ncbi:hypothetical protein Poli38472_006381 [Pythium oligandrum]|uniref:Uncharacterized protein n=1 Tax=Pythium oligandrum TaxID=41045 RepID=A0A8K1FBQ6_PYTOL|nr:hypothetical protein Poli38472_006381 [Pythium oligandrum]|eukprot:TMW56371.1 hypothetical protein Poli38472_006381 [Pythium oligandrum]
MARASPNESFACASEMEMSQGHEELVVIQGEAEEDDGSFCEDVTDRGDDDDDDESFCEYVGTTTRHQVGMGGRSRRGPMMWKRRVSVLLACATEPPGAGLAARLERLRRSIQREGVFDSLTAVIKALGHVLASGVCGASEALLVDNVLQIVQGNILRGSYGDTQDTDPLHDKWLTILCHCESSSVSQVFALRMVNNLVKRFINCGSDEAEQLGRCLQVQEQTLHAAAEDVQRCVVERAAMAVPHPQHPRGYQEEYQYLRLVQTGISDYGHILTAVKETESKLLQAKERRKFYEALLDLVLMLQGKLNITEEMTRGFNADGHYGLSFGVATALEQYCRNVLRLADVLRSEEDLMSLGDCMESFWLRARLWLSLDIQEMAASTLRQLCQHVPSVLRETIRRITRELSWMPHLTVDLESDEEAGWDE